MNDDRNQHFFLSSSSCYQVRYWLKRTEFWCPHLLVLVLNRAPLSSLKNMPSLLFFGLDCMSSTHNRDLSTSGDDSDFPSDISAWNASTFDWFCPLQLLKACQAFAWEAKRTSARAGSLLHALLLLRRMMREHEKCSKFYGMIIRLKLADCLFVQSLSVSI